jgi:hypothetical protein
MCCHCVRILVEIFVKQQTNLFRANHMEIIRLTKKIKFLDSSNKIPIGACFTDQLPLIYNVPSSRTTETNDFVREKWE